MRRETDFFTGCETCSAGGARWELFVSARDPAGASAYSLAVVMEHAKKALRIFSPTASFSRLAVAVLGCAISVLQAQEPSADETLVEIKAQAGLRFDVPRFRV